MSNRDERHRARIEAERRRRRRGAAKKKRRAAAGRGRRRRLLVAGGAVVVAAGIAGGGMLLTSRDREGQATGPKPTIGRAGSVEVPGAPAVEVTASPSSFRIVYRVEDLGAENVVTRTDVVSVRRPWESRLDSSAGAPPGGKRLSSQIATFGQRTNVSEGDEPAVVVLGPALPASDLRLAAVLAPATEAGRIERREVRRVLDRPCQVYRSGDYLSAAALTPPDPELYVDSCVDAAGLLLEEVLVSKERRIARRIAVEVDEDPSLDDALFPSSEGTVTPAKGGGSMRRLKEGTNPPSPFSVADAIPAGFASTGRFSVIPPQAENFGDDPEREGFRRAMVSDVYVRGVDVLIVEQGGTLRGGAPFEVDPGSPTVDLGALGTGEIRFSGVGNQVRVLVGGGRFIQATGTLSPEELAAVLRSLREVPGGQLEFADEGD